MRADKLLSSLCSEISRTQLQKLMEGGHVWKDDAVVGRRSILEPGDTITIDLPEPVPLELRAVPMELEVVYEDADIVVLNKASGVVVHPGAGTGEDTLVHGLLHHCRGQLSGIGGTERPGIVHRLDKDTSGLLVVAKSDRGYQGMTLQFSERSLEKYYQALLGGSVDWQTREVDQPIGRHPVNRMKMAIRDDGRQARSLFRRISNGPASTLVEVRIFTGRTHQIRVHARHLGHPLVGDVLYGYKGPPADRVMLHAWRLVFSHPVTGQPMDLRCEPDGFDLA